MRANESRSAPMLDLRPLLLTGGRLLDPSTGLDDVGDLLVAGGMIEAIGIGIGRPDHAEENDCTGASAPSAFIAVPAHPRSPGAMCARNT